MSRREHGQRKPRFLEPVRDGDLSGRGGSLSISKRQPTTTEQSTRQNHPNHPLQSPCFIHSYLDHILDNNREEDRSYFASVSTSAANGQPPHSAPAATFRTDAFPAVKSSRNIHDKGRPEPRHRGAQGAVEPESGSEEEGGSDASTSRNGSSASYTQDDSDDSEEEADRVRSLTRQLAETAVGVREMSKQLGRARVKSTIQSVLIITKARDNHLIKLTRELAIWLMTTPRNGKETGLTVYVDSQLRQSKRFDTEGIRKDYPDLFAPSPPRRQHSPEGEATGTDSNERPRSEASSSSGSSHIGNTANGREEGQLRYWTSDMCSRSPHLFDFVVTLGGDGTVLFCSWLFQRIVPPVMPFALGSLGFLTNFDYSDYKKVLKSALDTGIRVNLRMRFTATVYRAALPSSITTERKKRRAIKSGKTGEIIMRNIQEGGWDRIESPIPPHRDLRGAYTEHAADNNSSEDRSAPDMPSLDTDRDASCKKDKEVMCFSTKPVETFEVLNDLVVDRGPSPYVSLLEVFGDEHHMTTAQADGLCISTPTGSTAYSLSAGGSLVHPEIPAILITPICPHTLSFRPMLLPDSMELRIAVPYNSRSTAWASFDGRGRVELRQGDHIKVTASRYPFPTICAENQSTDWFESISRTLKWNERQRQKSFVVVEEANDDGSKRKKGKRALKREEVNPKVQQGQLDDTKKLVQQGEDGDDDDDADDDEEGAGDDGVEPEEQFDIDDSSTVVTRANSPTPGTGSHRPHHHHHHRRHSTHGSTRSSRPNGLSGSAPSLIANNPFLQKLQPLTQSMGGSSSSGDSLSSSQPLSRPTTGSGNGGTSRVASSGINRAELMTGLPIEGRDAGEARRGDRRDGTGIGSGRSITTSVETGSPSPMDESLLNSPDRFGLAGPPQPPRAISERHLATADFRLDDVKPEEEEAAEDRARREKTAAGSSSGSRAKSRQDSGSSVTAASSSQADGAPLLEAMDRSASANRLYMKLRGKARGDRNSDNQEGLHFSRSSSRSGAGTGTALVVYGQDESDSDSTAEG